MAVNDPQVTAPQPPAPPPSQPTVSPVVKVGKFLLDNAIYSALLLVVLVITYVDPTFISINSLRNILLNSSARVVIAMGASFAILTAGADLSAGRMVGFAAVLSASMLQAPDYLRLFYPNLQKTWIWVHLPWATLWIAIVIAIAACTVAGFINGLIIAKFNVAPFIQTLGMMVIILGVNSLYFDQEPNSSQPIGGLRADFTDIGTGAIGSGPYSVPYLVIIAAVVVFLMWVLMNKTVFGKNVYAIGGNVQAARVSGINVSKTTMIMYALAGALYGLGGVLVASRTGGATNNYGNMYELDAIAACVVGGVSVTGGIGTVPGIVSGVLIFTVIDFGLTFISINPYWQLIIRGVIIVSAVAFDVRKYVAKK
jgi:methyl-galactoside transport system permease protein